jgi:hypothetical protein
MDKSRPSSRYRYSTVQQVAEVLALARHWLPWELEAPVHELAAVSGGLDAHEGAPPGLEDGGAAVRFIRPKSRRKGSPAADVGSAG